MNTEQTRKARSLDPNDWRRWVYGGARPPELDARRAAAPKLPAPTPVATSTIEPVLRYERREPMREFTEEEVRRIIASTPYDPKGNPLTPRRTDLCLCLSCGKVFRSSGGFARHRVGPITGSACHRRCLTPTELIERGWLQTATGHWIRGRNPTKNKLKA